jgi:phosphonate transport system permease protein
MRRAFVIPLQKFLQPTPPNHEKPIKVKIMNRSTIVIRLTLLIMAVLTIYGFFTFDYRNVNLPVALQETLVNAKIIFTEPQLSKITFLEALYQVTITLGLAFLTTLLGAIISLFLAFFTAQNLSNAVVSNVIRSIVAFIRAVPTVLWVLIFAVSAGLGSVAAVVGMTFHTVGYLIKAYSESIEEMDEGILEALKASGANWWQIIFQAVIPSSASYIISWTFLRFEINFAVAIAMGAAAGAGGIGFDMFMASTFYYDLREIGALSYYILIFAILLELFATRLKKGLRTLN